MKKEKKKYGKAEAEIIRVGEQVILTSGFLGEGESVSDENSDIHDFNTLQ